MPVSPSQCQIGAGRTKVHVKCKYKTGRHAMRYTPHHTGGQTFDRAILKV
jgi:hypothetical protein